MCESRIEGCRICKSKRFKLFLEFKRSGEFKSIDVSVIEVSGMEAVLRTSIEKREMVVGRRRSLLVRVKEAGSGSKR